MGGAVKTVGPADPALWWFLERRKLVNERVATTGKKASGTFLHVRHGVKQCLKQFEFLLPRIDTMVSSSDRPHPFNVTVL